MSRALWRCAACGQEFTTYRRAEDHADSVGHHRLESLPGRYWPTQLAEDLLRPQEAKHDQK